MRIGPYEVVSTLGQGGMGVVYAARSPDGRAVAVKVLRRAGAEVLARFERERRLLAALGEAEGFVPLLDGGTTPAGPYLVMPLVPGGTLKAKLAKGPLGIEATVALGGRLALALGEAHGRGIVHRDLKPENVLFTATGLPLVADLGIAKHFDPSAPGASESVSLSAHGTLRGTVGYMAPEQMANAKSVGPAADVFSLGAILYECLAGQAPFVAANRLELLREVLEGKFEPLRSRRPDVPRWLAALVERALAPVAWDRFPDGLALGRALAAGAAGELPSRRRSRMAVLLGVGVAVLVGALGVAHARLPRADAHKVAMAAIAALDSENLVLGETEARRAFELDPSCGLAFTARGMVLWRKNDRPAAMTAFSRGIELEPGSATAWYMRGSGSFALGNRPQAIGDLTRAVSLDPGLERAWELRGESKAHEGDLKGAIADLTRAIELDAGRARAWASRASCWADLANPDRAIDDFTRALALAPNVPMVWRGRANAWMLKNDYKGAIDDLDRAIDLDAKDGLAWCMRGMTWTALGDRDRAIADLDRAIELEPNRPDSWGARASARSAKRDFDGAISDLEHFLEIAPDSPQAPWARAEIKRLLRHR